MCGNEANEASLNVNMLQACNYIQRPSPSRQLFGHTIKLLSISPTKPSIILYQASTPSGNISIYLLPTTTSTIKTVLSCQAFSGCTRASSFTRANDACISLTSSKFAPQHRVMNGQDLCSTDGRHVRRQHCSAAQSRRQAQR